MPAARHIALMIAGRTARKTVSTIEGRIAPKSAPRTGMLSKAETSEAELTSACPRRGGRAEGSRGESWSRFSGDKYQKQMNK